MGFHLGKPIAVMIGLACATGLLTRFTRNSGGRADLEMWSFAENHWRPINGIGNPPDKPSPLALFQRETGLSAQDKMIQNRAMNTRLSAMFLGNSRGPEVPDVVEIEIASVGQFFAQPVDQVGFLPLNDLIQQHGWSGRILASRLAVWSKDGQIFGIPCDVHPTTIAYNDEAFRAAGVDLSTSATWDKFYANCRQFEHYWRDERGVDNRWAMELPENNAGVLVAMLLERDVNLIDAHGGVHVNDPRVLDSLVLYCHMLAGVGANETGRVAVHSSFDDQALALDFAPGHFNAMLAPDWRLSYIVRSAPELAGKIRVMPMPRWPDSLHRTSTYGGTAMAIPRNSANPEGAFKLIESLFLKSAILSSPQSYILPPVRELWAADPLRDDHDAYFSGQPVRGLLRTLADEVPPRYVSSASVAAETALSQVLTGALRRLRSHGDAGFREYCESSLDYAQSVVLARIEHASQQ